VRSALQECAANVSPCYHAHTFTQVRTHARTHAHTPANTHAHMRVRVFAQFYARGEGTHAPARCRHTRSQAIRRCSRLRAARQTTHEHQSGRRDHPACKHARMHVQAHGKCLPACPHAGTDTRGRTRTRTQAHARMRGCTLRPGSRGARSARQRSSMSWAFRAKARDFRAKSGLS
jgi:hypothetical protein